MKNLLLIICIAVGFAGCSESDQTPDACYTLSGTWVGTTTDFLGRSTTYTYAFTSGLATALEYDGGILIAEHRYAYACNRDTLDLLNLATHGKQTATVVVIDPDTVLLDLFGWPSITLKRIL